MRKSPLHVFPPSSDVLFVHSDSSVETEPSVSTVAYRWILRLKLTAKVFDASTLSQNRRRRYQGETVPQAIFDRIVEQAMAHGLVDGRTLYTVRPI
jgi:hypothetical protein